MCDIRPFSTLNAEEFFRVDTERILMASRLANTIRSDAKDIRAAGDEVEIAVRDFYRRKLFPKYHVCAGHIVDQNMTISHQIDLIIADKMKNPVFNVLSNDSEMVYYEPVFGYAEIKKSFYKDNLLSDFSINLERVRSSMKRADIETNRLECSNDLLTVKTPLTDAPRRNMLFTFMFFTSSEGANAEHIKTYLMKRQNKFLPNMMVFLDFGIYVNINKKKYEEEHQLLINLYPEMVNDEQSSWAVLEFEKTSQILTYSYLLLLEHLKNTIVEAPDFMAYSKYLYKDYLLNVSVL